ncbi:hypothetical protein Tco_0748521, partial [Tanacetum coccineum]
TPSPDEEEVYKALQVCLEMQDSYVFRETIAPCKLDKSITYPSSEASSRGSTGNWIINNKEHGKASATAVLTPQLYESAGGLPRLKLPLHSCSLAGSTSAMEVSIPIAFVLPGREHECNESFKTGGPPALS